MSSKKNEAEGSVKSKDDDSDKAKLEAQIINTTMVEGMPNPIIHNLKVPWYQWMKMIFLSFTLLPIRCVMLILFFFICWGFAKLTIIGLSLSDITAQPRIRGWRRYTKGCCVFCGRCLFFFLGFHWVSTKNKELRKVDSVTVPALVIAPHSSFIDTLALAYLGLPSIVGRSDLMKYPFVRCKMESFLENVVNLCRFLAIMTMSEYIPVDREEESSKNAVMDKLTKRIHHREANHFPQMALFPEGTTTNRKSLLKFKTGAFRLSAPVQPIIIRYGNAFDCITWTWINTYSTVVQLWMIATQFHNFIEIEFLPVYFPDAKEKTDPQLYAKHVEKTIAAELQIPIYPKSVTDILVALKPMKLSTETVQPVIYSFD